MEKSVEQLKVERFRREAAEMCKWAMDDLALVGMLIATEHWETAGKQCAKLKHTLNNLGDKITEAING